jgi:hypothetical protein
MKYQEIRTTGVVYCNLSNQYCDDATPIEGEEQQIAIINESESGFLRAAGVLYACDEDDVDAMSLSSKNAMLDPSHLEFFEDDEEDALFQSSKGVVGLEDVMAVSSNAAPG